MTISSLNSKKCSTAKKNGTVAQALGHGLGSASLLFVTLTIAGHLLAPSTAHATKVPAIENVQLRKILRRDLESARGASFSSLLRQWDQKFGPRAVSPLLELAATRSIRDSERYTALMGAAKLGGQASAPLIQPFLKDSSWMLRAGALRALSALRNPQTAASTLALLQDPALVVRLEAVDAVEKLQPVGAPEALLRAIENRDNYHGNKAQWIPQRALKALASLKAREATPRLLPLLDRHEDPALLRQAVLTLGALNGRSVSRALPLSEQARQLKRALAPSAAPSNKRRG